MGQCSDRCKRALTDKCSCECGGRNHGILHKQMGIFEAESQYIPRSQIRYVKRQTKQVRRTEPKPPPIRSWQEKVMNLLRKEGRSWHEAQILVSTTFAHNLFQKGYSPEDALKEMVNMLTLEV